MYCKVIFPNNCYSKKYTYQTDINGIEKGDLVVVPTNNTFSLAEFDSYVEESEINLNRATEIKYVVQKVDFTDHEKREAVKKKKADILAKLEAKKKAFEEMKIYMLMAEADPEAAELLNELKSL